MNAADDFNLAEELEFLAAQWRDLQRQQDMSAIDHLSLHVKMIGCLRRCQKKLEAAAFKHSAEKES
jgi:hypothetical protein